MIRPRRAVTLAMVLCAAGGACRCSPKPEGRAHQPANDPTMKVATPMAPSSSSEPGTPADAGSGCPAALAGARTGGLRPGSYVVPSDEERRAVRAAIAKLLRGETVTDAATFGFEVVPLEDWPDAVLLRELPDRRRGGGAYVVRKASSSSLVVQAPHTFYDEGTFPLACDLFQRAKARALFINTVHRYKSSPTGADGKHPSDVAHAASSMFQAATEGAVDAIPRTSVVQLHGFAERGVGGRAVVSTGEKRAGSPLVARSSRALEAVVGPRILRYPEDTNELGATTNVQGAVVRRAAGGQFLHVEMEEGLRRDLLRDAALRGRALDAIGAAFSGP